MQFVSRTHKYKLLRTSRTKHIQSQMRIACSVYNHSIAIHKCYYRIFKKHLSAFSLQKHLTKLKNNNPHKEHWKLLDAWCLNEITERIDLAYKKFFRKENKRPPTFQKSSTYSCLVFKSKIQNGERRIQGITFDKNQFTITGSQHAKKLDKNCAKKFKFKLHRPMDGELRRVSIVKNNLNEFFLCVALQKEIAENTEMGRTTGIDFGLKTFLTLSNGTRIQSPEEHKKALKKIKTLSRRLSLKKKGSNNRRKAKEALARLQKLVSNKRKDFAHKTSTTLAKAHDIIFSEDLNLSGMIKLWGRKVLDLGFANFMSLLSYKTKVVKIGRFQPTTSVCSGCGHKQKMTLKDRIFDCEKCDLILDRDLNAAKNILRVGEATLAVDEVRLAPVSVCC